MDKPEINQDVYEQYLDATVALFMERYSTMLTDKISSEDNGEDIPFPEMLDAKCRALIKKEATKRKQLTLWKHTRRMLKAVAAFAIAVLATFSLLFVSVDAFRVQVVNFYIEHGDGHWSINPDVEKQEAQTGKLNINDPLGGLIPSDYALISISNDDPQRITAIYENAAGNRIRFVTIPFDALAQIDVEDADVVKEIKIHDFDAVFVTKHNASQLTVHSKASDMMYVIIADNSSEKEIIAIAEKLIPRISN